MWLSRIWVLVLAIAVAVGLAIAFVVHRPAARDLARAHMQSLDHVQHNADLLLRLEARDWIDYAAGVTKDRALVEVLEQASDGQRDAKVLQSRANARLLYLVGQIKPEDRPELIVALDFRGKHVARIGPGEEVFKPGIHGLAGSPLVEAALRGYRRDDTWSYDGRLFLMAASPVISKAKGRYVGAVLIGQEVNAGLAKQIKSRLGSGDVAFFLRGKMLASTVESPALAKLPQQFTKRQEAIAKAGRSPALQVGEGRDAHTVVMAPLPGEAAQHDAFYAVVASAPPAAGGLGQALGRLQGGDWGEAPWLLLAGLVVALLVIGVALQIVEVERPVSRVDEALHKVARGEAPRVDEGIAGRLLAPLARGVNECLAKSAAKRAPAAAGREPAQATEPSHEEVGARRGAAHDLDDGVGLPPLSPIGSSSGGAGITRLPSLRPATGSGSSPSIRRRPAPPPEPETPADSMPTIAAGALPLAALEPEEAPTDLAPPPFPSLPPPAFGGEPGYGDTGVLRLDEALKVSAIPTGSSPPAFGGGAKSYPAAASRSRSDLPHEASSDSLPADVQPPFGGFSEPFAATGSSPLATGSYPAEGVFPVEGDSFPEPVSFPKGNAFASEPSMPSLSMPGGAAADSFSMEPLPMPSVSEPEELLSSVRVRIPPSEMGGYQGADASGTDTVMSSIPAQLARSAEDEQLVTPPPEEGLEPYFKEVYNDFLSLKRQCGEDVSNLTFDRFAAKLHKNRDSLIERYGCKSVKFQVYIKDGKAALKATPLKD
ncbi:MAG: hypothetical protein IT371_25060 [Deltaproteobacteria bacterium]|nr:hypothetical protein [Deltaproteobacteria bacterium]